MVSLWPWKGPDNSPASFEKTLSALAEKITQTATRLDRYRQRSRRFKALWTLYTTFGYLLYSLILALALGWRNWGVVEYGAVVGGPFVIYVVRATASRVFEYRISTTSRHLESLQRQRDETIEKLKIATKYDSTLQLLEKYGHESPSPSHSPSSTRGEDTKGQQAQKRPLSDAEGRQQQPEAKITPKVLRTGLPPPPTANIVHRTPSSFTANTPRTNAAQSASTPVGSPELSSGGDRQLPFTETRPTTDEPGFAPNAFSARPAQAADAGHNYQYADNSALAHGHWYDRLLDVLLGEDEMQAKNRTVLICSQCRLVNGQAPPGVKSLKEIGRWRCYSCGAWNGEDRIRVMALGMGDGGARTTQNLVVATAEAGATAAGMEDDGELSPQSESDDSHKEEKDRGTTYREVRGSRGRGAATTTTETQNQNAILSGKEQLDEHENEEETDEQVQNDEEQDEQLEPHLQFEAEVGPEPSKRTTRSRATKSKKKG